MILTGALSAERIKEAIGYNIDISSISHVISSDYAKRYVRASIDSISKSFKRNNPLDDDDRSSLADKMVRKCSHWTLKEFHLFEDMLVCGDLDGELKVVDVASIMMKVRVFDVRMQQYRTTRTEQQQNNKQRDLPTLSPSDWRYSHDFWGNKLPSDVDPQRYWFDSSYNKEEMKTIAEHVMSKVEKGLKVVS